jgi:hypothetical protein
LRENVTATTLFMAGAIMLTTDNVCYVN